MTEKDRAVAGNKCLNGRKRAYLVDTGARLWSIVIHAVDITDGK